MVRTFTRVNKYDVTKHRDFERPDAMMFAASSSIEWNLIRLGGPALGIMTKSSTQNSARHGGGDGVGALEGGGGVGGLGVVGFLGTIR